MTNCVHHKRNNFFNVKYERFWYLLILWLVNVGSVVSGTLTLLIGYRWMSDIGDGVMALGVFASSFSEPTDTHSFVVFYGVLPGIRRNMIVVPATIVVLEYSKKYGEKNLLASESGIITIRSAMVLIHTWMAETVWGAEWKNYLYLQTALAVMMAVVSVVLRPLDAPEVTTDAETPNEGTALSTEEEATRIGTDVSAEDGTVDNISKVRSLVSNILDYSSLSIYKKPFLYTFGFMWFFWDGGQAIIDYSFDAVETYADIRHSALMLRLVSLLGPGALFILLKTKGLSLLNLCIMIVVSCSCIGIPSFLASQLDNRGFTIFYAALVGFLKGAADTAPLFTTRMVVGEEHLAIGTGVLVLGHGLGIVTMTTAADGLYKSPEQVDGGLYLSGVLLLLGAGFTGYLLPCSA